MDNIQSMDGNRKIAWLKIEHVRRISDDKL